MKTYKAYITEMARRNPDQNPRVSAFDRIVAKGYNDADIFFSFTSILKIGINPRSKHDTPNGIYTFPAREIVGMVKGNMNNAPYVGGQPYIHVLRSNMKGVVDPLESYSKSNYNKDIKKIYKLVKTRKSSLTNMVLEYLDAAIEDAEKGAKLQTPIGWLWNVTRMLTRDDLFLDFMGWKGVKSAKIKSWYAKTDNFTTDMWGRKKKIPRNDRKGNVHLFSGVAPNAQGWNNLLRALGYKGFVDRTGSGLIHSNEPTQAVFLDTSAYKVLEVIENKHYDRLRGYDKLKGYVKTLEDKGNTFSVSSLLDKHEMAIVGEISKSDLKGCDIDYDKQIYITGGVFKDGYINTEYVYLDNVRIEGGNFVHIRSIYQCEIVGGNFNYCEFKACTHLDGYYERSKFLDRIDFKNCHLYNNNYIQPRSTFHDCKVTHNELLYGCKFSGFTYVENTGIQPMSDEDGLLDDQDCKFTRCKIVHHDVLAGSFRKTDLALCTIKGGLFNDGKIKVCKIHDGVFMNVDMVNNEDMR